MQSRCCILGVSFVILRWVLYLFLFFTWLFIPISFAWKCRIFNPKYLFLIDSFISFLPAVSVFLNLNSCPSNFYGFYSWWLFVFQITLYAKIFPLILSLFVCLMWSVTALKLCSAERYIRSLQVYCIQILCVTVSIIS